MTSHDSRPSLLDNEARGGDTAEAGFSFQEAVIMASIPEWLAHDGFTMATREALCDSETAFFLPSFGLRRDGIEAKNFVVPPAIFWDEIRRFQSLDAGHPGVFQWFTLASPGISDSLSPLINGLRRVRGPFAFYGLGSSVTDVSFEAYVDVVEKLGRTRDDARFLFERVLLDRDWPLEGANADALFRKRLEMRFPEFAEYPANCARKAWQELLALVKSRKNAPIFRHEVEQRLDLVRPANGPRPGPALRLHTARDDSPGPIGAVRYDWAEFFGGTNRWFPGRERWNEMMRQLRDTDDWIRQHQRPRTIRLSGERRLSAAIALGAAFSAVGGYVVDMEHRGAVWSTATHATSQTPLPHVEEYGTPGTGSDLVVSIGVVQPVRDDVVAYAAKTSLRSAPALHLQITTPIIAPDHANAAAAAIKCAVGRAVASVGATAVHLFYGGPSHLALFMGHRWNTAVELQCYEWQRAGEYVPTCLIPRR